MARKIMTENRIKKIEEVLELDSNCGLYLINSKYLRYLNQNKEKYLQTVNTSFNLGKKLVCSYNKEGLERYNKTFRG